MEKVLLYEKAIGILDERYGFIKRSVVAGNRDVAMSLYHSCGDYLGFMLLLELIDYKMYCHLVDKHHYFFDMVFSS